MTNDRKEHFIVISERRGPASHPARHDDPDRAVTEAARLARENPGQSFYVYRSLCSVRSAHILITSHSPSFHPPFDDEIPF